MADKSEALAQFLELLPEGAGPAIFAIMAADEFNLLEAEAALAGIDWQIERDVVEDILRAVVPIAELVPDVYEKWRPVVRDGFAFVGARLSPERLVPKLIEQLTLAEETAVEDRIIAFIRRIPSLQKIGQIVARNRNLNPEFRARLSELEDAIHEVEEDEIRAEIDADLGYILLKHQVTVEPGLYAEGSVSAIVRFTRLSPPAGEPNAGVLKVLKPFIPKYFQEDLTLLSELADYFDANQKKYDLDEVNMRSILDNVRELFERETDFENERDSLAAAGKRFKDVRGVRVPEPFPSLSTDTISAMTEERSVKVTDAYAYEPQRRDEIARKLVEALVAIPLFSDEAESSFHADPHAGNLRLDVETGDLVILDWALTGSLSIEERRGLILLFLALPLRDEGQIMDALSELSESKTESDRALLKRQIELFIDSLPLGKIPGAGSLSDLVGRLLRSGLRFSSSFLIFRKMLITLGDVIEQLSEEVTIERAVAEYALARGLAGNRCPESAKPNFTIPLKASDIFRIGLSLQSLFPRVWAQSVRSLVRNSESALTSGNSAE